MQMYVKFEGFPLFDSALFELVYDTMTPCRGQLCPKEEELLPVATFRWSPSRLEGARVFRRNCFCKITGGKRKTLGQNEASFFARDSSVYEEEMSWTSFQKKWECHGVFEKLDDPEPSTNEQDKPYIYIRIYILYSPNTHGNFCETHPDSPKLSMSTL